MGNDGSLALACRREVEALHAFFGAWFRGEGPAGGDGFARCADVLAHGFEIISPDGRATPRAALLEHLAGAHGVHAGAPFEIRVTEFRCRDLTEALALATYREWHQGAEGRRGRLSTALFRARTDAPCGVEWLHVHETWLPEGARP